MSDSDDDIESGAQRIAIMVVSLLGFATVLVIFSIERSKYDAIFVNLIGSSVLKMSEEDEIPIFVIMIAGCIGLATVLVIISVGKFGHKSCRYCRCYRICLEDWRKKKQKLLRTNETEPNSVNGVVNIESTTQVPDSLTFEQRSDFQLVFGVESINSPSSADVSSADVSSAISNPQTAQREEISDSFALSPEYALHHDFRSFSFWNQLTESERDDRDEPNVKETIPVPPYSLQDESLPSYDQATKQL
ncbi:hypothetical protein Bhyg_03795 [Pseudolycoriella hygida]|uniref:Uncharacterized protein n=1 Tax=Pseudolycoriella hygida TaxID=35572 RepID=A0A9Q0S9R8_9DIPT|nr:hypothetical protein Bhyg_03795 [Pseudolycoriella hygida]